MIKNLLSESFTMPSILKHLYSHTVAITFVLLGTAVVSGVKLTRTSKNLTRATVKIQLYATLAILERGMAGTEESKNTAVSGFLLGLGLKFK